MSHLGKPIEQALVVTLAPLGPAAWNAKDLGDRSEALIPYVRSDLIARVDVCVRVALGAERSPAAHTSVVATLDMTSRDTCQAVAP